MPDNGPVAVTISAGEVLRRNKAFVTWLVMCAPWILLLACFTLAAHVRLGLGHWPEPFLENYDTTAFELHALVVNLVLLFAALGAIPLWLCLQIVPRWRISAWTWLGQFLTCVAGWGVFWYIAFELDPHDFVDWFLD